MENMVIDASFWNGRKVLVSGSTGFKGGWLSLWLHRLGAEVSGFGRAPNTDPSLFALLDLQNVVPTTIADINDRTAFDGHLLQYQPEIIFHLAAQPLVRLSYEVPVDTFAANVLGTANVLDAVRHCPPVRAVVVVTSDKCYENREWAWGYRENEAMGGHDPYSASKGCAELVVASMRRSFFSTFAPHRHPAHVASARAGNVIGGGDWSADRLVPDIVRGCLGPDGVVKIRNPKAVRPWQHVLEPLGGYLSLAERLFAGSGGFDEGWNFGPSPGDERRVLEVATAFVKSLKTGRIELGHAETAVHEANLLRLDIAKARERLGWRPLLDFEQSVAWTAVWYACWLRGENLLRLCCEQIDDYMKILGNA